MKVLHRSDRLMISLFFVLTITFCCVCADSYATDYNSLTGFSAGVASITVSGGTVAHQVTPVISGDQYTYNIDITEDWSSLNSNKKVTITFAKNLTNYPNCEISTNQPGVWPFRKKKVRDGASLVYEATIDQTNLNGSTTAYVYYDLENHVTSYKTYVFNVTCNGALNPRYLPDSSGLHVKFGDPAYPDTEPECDMKIVNTSTANYYTVEYGGSRTGFYPGQLALYVKPSSGKTTADVSAVTSSGGAVITSYGVSDGHKGFLVDLNALTADSTVEITDGAKTIYLTFHKPAEETASGSGTTPTSVVSYLPLGQFATGNGWGSSANKFVGISAPESTGVSLGSLGGYVEFYFANGITNNDINSYGVDFTVYGNAFNGNPEAGSVQVSEDGKVWYELAGSLYYEDGFTTSGVTAPKLYVGTKRNCSVSYEKDTAGINATINPGNNPLLSVNPFTTSLTWFPESSEGYPMGLDLADAVSETGGPQNYKTYHNATGSTISIDYDADNGTLDFGGITVIEDSDSNVNYGYGYCDVTPNGSMSAYGTAVNPYEVYTNGKTGGDGFDLEWAVDNDGVPVNVNGKTFKYVRVYSSVLHIQPPFGETSAEVTGIFLTANPEGKQSVNRTTIPQINVGNVDLTALISTGTITPTQKGNVYYVTDLTGLVNNNTTITASASNTKIYINNDSDGEYTYHGSKYVRIVAQNGFKAPYILVLKLS